MNKYCWIRDTINKYGKLQSWLFGKIWPSSFKSMGTINPISHLCFRQVNLIHLSTPNWSFQSWMITICIFGWHLILNLEWTYTAWTRRSSLSEPSRSTFYSPNTDLLLFCIVIGWLLIMNSDRSALSPKHALKVSISPQNAKFPMLSLLKDLEFNNWFSLSHKKESLPFVRRRNLDSLKFKGNKKDFVIGGSKMPIRCKKNTNEITTK
jgi:hypothetical protein